MKALITASSLSFVILSAACASTGQQPQQSTGPQSSVSPQSQSTTMLEEQDVANAYVQALEEADMSMLLSLYSEDAEIFVQDKLAFSGVEGARHSHEYEQELDTEQFVVFSSSNGDRFQMVLEGTNEFYRLIGVERFQQRMQLTIEDGQIVSARSSYDDESMRALSEVFPKFLQWVSANQPQAFEQIFTKEGALNMNGDTGKTLVELARRFRAEQG